MCFSAEASFIAAGVLCVAGIFSVSFAKSTGYRLLACTPFLFAIQQAFEGIAWITSQAIIPGFLHFLSVHVFLTFAFLIWPIWIPGVLTIIEDKKNRRNFLWFLLIIGIGFSSYTLSQFLTSGGIIATFTDHARYTATHHFPISAKIYLLLYVLATIMPFFISSVKLSKWFGILILASILFTYFFIFHFFTSVWCFFSAILSIIIVAIVKANQGNGR